MRIFRGEREGGAQGVLFILKLRRMDQGCGKERLAGQEAWDMAVQPKLPRPEYTTKTVPHPTPLP